MAFLEFITESFWNWAAVLFYLLFFYAFVLTALSKLFTPTSIVDYEKLALAITKYLRTTSPAKSAAFLEDDDG